MNELTKSPIIAPVAPTAPTAEESGDLSNAPSTAISAALNIVCTRPDKISGIAYAIIKGKRVPFVKSIFLFFISPQNKELYSIRASAIKLKQYYISHDYTLSQ
jgi:hypothetical protein